MAEIAVDDELVLVVDLELHVYDLADGAELTSLDLPQGLKVMAATEGLAVVGSGRTLGAYTIVRERSLREAWRFSGTALSGTGVAAGDLVVVGNVEREVVAVDRATGRERWRSDAFDEVDASGGLLQPTVAGDLVLVADSEGDDSEVVALSLDDGEEVWRVPVDTADGKVDAEVAGDLLVLGVEPLQGVNPETGRVIWRRDNVYPSARGGVSSMALDGDGTTVVTAGTSELAAFDGATGEPRWRTALPLDVYADDDFTLDGTSGIAVDGDRVVVALATGGLAIDRIEAHSMADGSSLWEADVPGGGSSMAVGEGIVVTAQAEQLVALDLSTGASVWEAAGRDSSPGLAVGDGVVVAWGVGLLLADASTGEVLDEVSSSEIPTEVENLFFSPPIVSPVLADGMVVIQSNDETLVAYQS